MTFGCRYIEQLSHLRKWTSLLEIQVEEASLVRNLQDVVSEHCFDFFSAGISHDFAQNNQVYTYFSWMRTRISRRYPVRPKARGLAQHGGPPGWQQESDPACMV
jgi:hypothetical protein